MALALLVAAGATLLVVPAAAAGAVLFVDRGSPACSDGGAGTALRPFCTIGAAAARAAPGQTVKVGSGVYPERVVPAAGGTAAAPIAYLGRPGTVVTGGANGFVLASRSWVTVQGFTVTGTSGDGISVSGSSHVSLLDNRVSAAGQPAPGATGRGISLSGVTDSLVAGNTVDHNTDAGIYLSNGSTGVEVRGNTVLASASGYQRLAAGIDVRSGGNTVAGNTAAGNEDSGIQVQTGAAGNAIVNNLTHDNGDHGIDVLNAPGQVVVGNTVVGNVTSGINLDGTSSGATLANNVSVDNAVASPRGVGNILVGATAAAGTLLDHDLVFLSAGGTLVSWKGVRYDSLEAFRLASGQEAGGLAADPLFVSTADGDFHLRTGSPAIDSADSGVSGEGATDAEGLPRVDDPATPNTGAGPRPYDDRGAFEYQPEPGDQPPVTRLTVSPASGDAPLTVTADASASTDPDATPISSYEFDFGDGSAHAGPGPAATATHQFAEAGTFAVTVTVLDTAGLAGTATATVSVTGPTRGPIRYVDGSSPTCTDAGAGTAANPYCTIDAAAGGAVPGDTVQVAAGTYAEEVRPARSGTSSQPIVYTPAPGASVTITGAAHGFTLASRSWITVSWFTISGTGGHGLYVSGSDHITLRGNRVTLSGQPLSGETARGIYLSKTTDSLVSGNVVDHNSDSGIYVSTGCARLTISGNAVFANARGYQRAAAGIDLRSPGLTVSGNVTSGNEDSGIQAQTGASGNLIVNNLSYGNGDHGIDVLNAPGQLIVGNTVHGNATSGINVEGTSSGASVANNVSVDNAVASPRAVGNIRVDPQSVAGTSVDYNLVFMSGGGVLYSWDNANYATIAQFRSASGQETHGLAADPLFVSAGDGDFRLRAGSPAIDSADSGAPGQASTDIAATARRDDPATVDTGAGPRPYDDRGAFEF